MEQEEEPLLGAAEPLVLPSPHISAPELSVAFAMACIVDQFGILSVITLPRSIILCGWIGFPLAVAVFALSIYTAMLLGRCWVIAESLDSSINSKARSPYPAIVKCAWGEKASRYFNWYLNVGLFCGNVPALVVASQNLQSLYSRASGNWYNISYCYWLIILGAASCPFTWLGSPKDLKWVSGFSAGAVIVCSLMTWICMIKDDTKAFSYRDVPHFSWQPFGIAYGNLAFQLACHPTILAIQSDMRKKSDLSRSVLCSFFVTGGLIITTSVLCVIFYGAGINANITEGLPNSFLLIFDLGLIILQLFLSTIVGGCPLFQDIEDKLLVPNAFCWQRCVLRSLLVMSAVLFAEMLPRFDLVMGLIGGLFSGPTTFIIPPLIYYKLRSLLPEPVAYSQAEPPLFQRNSYAMTDTMRHFKKFLKKNFFSLDISTDEDGALSSMEILVACVIVILGVIATFMATYYSFRSTVWSAQFVPPCLFDVQAASKVISR